MFTMIQRVRQFANPPSTEPKATDALRFGILGAARIAPNALINPAKSHPDVIVAAVASRSQAKAVAYARKYNIPVVVSGEDCYQELIDDPTIDAIYNPLPNSLHFEYTMRALVAGKHVLCEKPIADTEAEAHQMFALAASKGLVLLEAVHWTFHPAAQRFKAIVDSGELGRIQSIDCEFCIPVPLNRLFFESDDVRYKYDLGGGCMMDMGVYPLSAIRYLSSSNPLDVESATATPHSGSPTPSTVDRAMKAVLVMPNDIIGTLTIDFASPGWGPFGLFPRGMKNAITVRGERGEAELSNPYLSHLMHAIRVKPTKLGAVRDMVEARTEYAYGERPWWTTYRHQLEAFVDKVRGRTPQHWFDESESFAQMHWVEQIYEKAGLPLRPASNFELM